MGCLPYFKLYPGDWLMGVRHLTLEEQGAYITFLCWSWENGPLPVDPAARARLLGVTPRKFASLWINVGPLWNERQDGFVNRRMERDRRDLEEKHRRRVVAGSRGGKATAARQS